MFENELIRLRNELTLRGYSSKTLRAYQDGLKGYFLYLERLGIRRGESRWDERLETSRVRAYLLGLHELGRAANTINLHLNAILFYLRHVCFSPRRISIPFAKKPKRLPVVLSREEMECILSAIKNPKHYAMIALAYGAGLRLGELVRLRVEHLDFQAGFLRVRQAKGKKDRVTFIPKRIHSLLYRMTAAKRPSDYVFENEQRGSFYLRASAHAQKVRAAGGECDFSGERLSERTLQALFKQALAKSGIKKAASFHSLRHSFATNLLEKGVDIHQLQTLMGHNSIKTTQGYLHVTPKSLRNLESPL